MDTILTQEVQKRLHKGESPESIFDKVYDSNIKGIKYVDKNGKKNYLRLSDNQILSKDVWFDRLSNFKHKVAKVIKGNKYSFINIKGGRINDVWYDFADNFNDYVALVQKDGKFNFINTKGEELFEWRVYDNVRKFEDGVAEVRVDKTNKFLSKKGNLFDTKYQAKQDTIKK